MSQGNVSAGLSVLIDCVVAILLVLTIGYCMILNRRLKLLKADEQSLRATISELVTATEIAERAIAGLKSTMREGEQTLGERLERSGQLSTDIERQLKAGEDLLARLTRIAIAGRAVDEPAPAPDARAVAAAAQAFAERARARMGSLAA